MLNTEVAELTGEDTLTGLVVLNNETRERRELPARALFVFIGAQPCTDWLRGAVDLDDRGFILTGHDIPRDEPVIAPAQPVHDPLLLETSRPGVFAAGDVRSGSIKRVASAVGEGSMAIRFVWEHLAGVHELDRPATPAHGPRAERSADAEDAELTGRRRGLPLHAHLHIQRNGHKEAEMMRTVAVAGGHAERHR